jgi:hypothetical protein
VAGGTADLQQSCSRRCAKSRLVSQCIGEDQLFVFDDFEVTTDVQAILACATSLSGADKVGVSG